MSYATSDDPLKRLPARRCDMFKGRSPQLSFRGSWNVRQLEPDHHIEHQIGKRLSKHALGHLRLTCAPLGPELRRRPVHWQRATERRATNL